MSKTDSTLNEPPAVENTSALLGVQAAPLGLSPLLDELKARKGLLDFETLPPLLDVKTVAAMLSCSARHIYRLSDAGKMPAPVKLGALVRWSKKPSRPGSPKAARLGRRAAAEMPRTFARRRSIVLD